MTKRTLIAAGFVAALAGGSAVAIAQPPHGGPGMHAGRGARGGGPLGDLGLRGLELSDAQRDQVKAIMDARRGEMTDAAQKLRDAHQALAAAAEGTTVDEAAIRARSAALANALAEQAIVRARVRADVHGVLTAEQLQQLRERAESRLKRQQERLQQRQQRLQQRKPPQ